MKKLSTILLGIFCFSGVVTAGDNKITAVPLFQSCGIYFEATDMSTPCATEFREKGSDKWNKAFILMTIPEKKPDTYLGINYKNGKPLYSNYHDNAMFRGCIVNLKEDTEYEIKIYQGKNTYTAEFRTWTSNPPIAKTINMKDLKFDNELIITEKGMKNGWIKYTANKDFVLKGDDKKNAVITVKGGEYIIFENLKIEGGARHGISLEDANNIRVLNCDISGYGRIGKQDVSKDGKYYENGNDAYINNDAGVNIARSGNVVVERCYIHDPRGHANSWKYTHPAGPNAIAVTSTGDTVLRYNDFIGSDKHRWNDAVESTSNWSMRGGFFKDAEIYGNMFIYSNDDSIELDGGQMNTRVFLNKIEGSLCGISTGPCHLGPSYIFQNLIVNLADEDNISSLAFKNGHGFYDRGRCYLFNNTVYGNIIAYGNYNYGQYVSDRIEYKEYNKELRGFTQNNIFYCLRGIFDNSIFMRNNYFDYDLIYSNNSELIKSAEEKLKEKGWEKHGIFGKDPEFANVDDGIFTLTKNSPALKNGALIDNFIEKYNGENPDRGAFQSGQDMPLPYRPMPVYLNKYQVNFKFDIGEDIPFQTVDANVKGVEKFVGAFEIRKNNPFDWFTVEPSKGTFKENSSIQFRVSVDKEKLRKIGLYKGLFLIRLENGYSRPVTVYAKVEGKEELKKQGECFALYIEAEKPSSTQPFRVEEDEKASEGKSIYLDVMMKNMSLSYDFEIPQDGDYFIFVRVKSEEPVTSHNSIFISVDGEEKRPMPLWSYIDWKWCACGPKMKINPYSLKKGKHTVKIAPRESIYFDILLITDNYKLVY